MRTFKITLAYDGTAYAGWQVQLRQRTLQAEFEASLLRVTGETIRVAASGRTDSGVHALGQGVSFSCESNMAPVAMQRALNSDLPVDMGVLGVAEVPAGFHATRDAVCKRYRYVIHDNRTPDVFRRQFSWHFRGQLDAAAMHRAAQAWRGTHDFASFESRGPQRTTSVRTVLDLEVTRGGLDVPDLVTFEVEADGFLYNMVRSMIGTLVQVGHGRQPESWPAEVLAARHRGAAGMTAPPQGLFLLWVKYGEAGQGGGGGPSPDVEDE